MHIFNGARWNKPKASGLPSGDFNEPLPNAFVKSQTLALEPITFRPGPRPAKALLRRSFKQERHIGHQRLGRTDVHPLDQFKREPAPVRLIRRRRIKKPITKNMLARIKRRPDYPADMLRPVGLI